MNRLLQFRRELLTLWQAFWAGETPLYLKGLMLLVPLYLVSPIDLVPDFIPIAGWIDDAIVIPVLVSFIVGLLPKRVPVYSRAPDGGKMIDGSYRRR